MNWQIALIYVAVAVLCTVGAIRLLPRHFPGEFFAYLIVGLIGAWVGNILGLPFGALVCGVSIWASCVGAAFLIELDYQVNANICDPSVDVAAREPESNVTNATGSKKHLLITE